jgi:hypothetical protein
LSSSLFPSPVLSHTFGQVVIDGDAAAANLPFFPIDLSAFLERPIFLWPSQLNATEPSA